MSYRHIENLYRNKDILLFKQCYALCKVHGTSAHICYIPEHIEKVDSKVGDDTFYEKKIPDKLTFFSGGAKHEQFVALFNQEDLLIKFRENAKEHPGVHITVYGEAYGGKLQGMSDTYGKDLKFIAFEVKINEDWLGVFQAEKMANKLGFEFVPYEIINTTEEEINAAMMKDSEVAIRRGTGIGRMREGVVLRPLVELIHPNGGRIICKHKRPEFSERKHTPKFSDPQDLKILKDAETVADEWVLMERLRHVFDAIGLTNPQMEDANKIIKGMIEDVYREAKGEIVESKEVRKAISKKTMELLKKYLNLNAITA